MIGPYIQIFLTNLYKPILSFGSENLKFVNEFSAFGTKYRLARFDKTG